MTIKLTNAKTRDLLTAHNLLDGYDEVVEQNGQKNSIRRAYVFPAKTIYAITKNIGILRRLVEKANADRENISKRLKAENINPKDNPDEWLKLVQTLNESELDEVEVRNLFQLKMTDILNDDLEGDESKKKPKNTVPNPIPGTVLASLSPVLDIFQETDPDKSA